MLADIELAQTLQAAPGEEEKLEEVPHPLDRDYQLLRCQLQLLDNGGLEYKVSPSILPLRCLGSLALSILSCMPRPKESSRVGEPWGASPWISQPWSPGCVLHRRYRPTWNRLATTTDAQLCNMFGK